MKVTIILALSLLGQSPLLQGMDWDNYPIFEDKTVDELRIYRVELDSPPRGYPRLALGLGLNFPDIFPVEAYIFANPWLSMRLFAVWAIPFKIRVEYGRSVLASQGGLSIENPDLTVDFDAVYGPQYGLESLVHPFANSFYVGMGLSYRRLRLKGDLTSELILSSSAGSVDSNSLISLKASAYASQVVYRANVGWIWTFFQERSYVNLTLLGITLPRQARSDVEMQASIINPIATVDIKNETIEEAEGRFADDLARQAKDSIRPVEKVSLPIIGISGGIVF